MVPNVKIIVFVFWGSCGDFFKTKDSKIGISATLGHCFFCFCDFWVQKAGSISGPHQGQ